MQTEEEQRDKPVVGQWVEGLDAPVVNERAVRASAGILFLAGFSACVLRQRFSRTKPTLCAGDTCTYTPPAREERHVAHR